MTEKPAASEVSDFSSPSHLSEMITETNGDEKIPTAYLKDTNSSSLPLCNGGTEKKQKKEYQFGNYKHYYGYRNKDHNYKDIRLDILQAYEELFHGREILDIGCNNGQLTMSIADQFIPKHITGMDIEQSLINEAKKCLIKEKKCLPWENEKKTDGKFPYNVTFIRGDYVLRDDILLEVEEEQNFDVILALSITKWIHLNYGDAGLKQAFRRMYRQLRCHGILILEAQPFDNYKRRKNINVRIYTSSD